MKTLFEALLNGWWQGLVLTLLVWLVMRESQRINAATRAAIWQVTLLVVLLLPALQRIPLRFGPVEQSQTMAAQPRAVPESERPQPVIEMQEEHGPEFLMAASIALAFLQLLRLAFGYWLVRRLKRNGQPSSISMPITNSRPTRLLISERISMPMALGYLRPAIMLPRGLAERLTQEEMHCVLLHESSHLSRGDDWMALIERLIRAVFFFQPAIHFIGRQIEREREMACDDWVVAQSGEPKAYASALARLAELGSSGRAPILATGVGRRKQIFARLETLLDRTRNRLPSVSEPLVILAGIALVLVVSQGAQFNRLIGLSHFSTTWLETDGTNRREMKMRGDVDFSPDQQDVSRMSPGAMLVVEQADEWRRQRVEFEADDEGIIQRRYFSDAMQRPFGVEGRRFAAVVLPQWAREQGHDIPARIARAIQQKGVDGTLDDIRKIRSTEVRTANLEELFTQAELDAGQLQRVQKIVRQMDSEEAKTAIMQRVRARLLKIGGKEIAADPD